MTAQNEDSRTVLKLDDPKTRRSLAQVYRLLIDLANESEAPAESTKTIAGAPDGDRPDIDRQTYDTPSTSQEQAQCAA